MFSSESLLYLCALWRQTITMQLTLVHTIPLYHSTPVSIYGTAMKFTALCRHDTSCKYSFLLPTSGDSNGWGGGPLLEFHSFIHYMLIQFWSLSLKSTQGFQLRNQCCPKIPSMRTPCFWTHSAVLRVGPLRQTQALERLWFGLQLKLWACSKSSKLT